MQSVERIPDSYNKLLIQASCEYCLRVLGKLCTEVPGHRELLADIRKLISSEQDLLIHGTRDQVGTVALLNLQVLEDRFSSVQERSEHLGILATIEKMPIDQLFDR